MAITARTHVRSLSGVFALFYSVKRSFKKCHTWIPTAVVSHPHLLNKKAQNGQWNGEKRGGRIPNYYQTAL